MTDPRPASPIREVVGLFLKLGLIGFGGPAAHIALMHREVVDRRGWVSRERFLDLLGATNLIPGSNSPELAIHLGFARAGWPGLLAGGAAFITPAALIVLGCAWLYTRWGSLPEVSGLLYGVKPVLIGILVQVVTTLARTALSSPRAWIAAVLVLGCALAGGNEALLLFSAATAVMLAARLSLRHAYRSKADYSGTIDT